MFKRFIVQITRDKVTEEKVIDTAEFTIGRSLDVDLTLADPNVSRKHSTVTFENDIVFIIDQSSANGTFVNQRKIKPLTSVLIKNSDIILIGSSGFELKINAVCEDIKKEVKTNTIITKDAKKITESKLTSPPPLAENKPASTAENISKPTVESEQLLNQINNLQNQLEELETNLKTSKELNETLKTENIELNLYLEKTKDELSFAKKELNEIQEKNNSALAELLQTEEKIIKANINERILTERLKEKIDFEEKKLTREFDKKKEAQEQKINLDLSELLNQRKVLQIELDEIKTRVKLYKEDEIHWQEQESHLKNECKNIEEKVQQSSILFNQIQEDLSKKRNELFQIEPEHTTKINEYQKILQEIIDSKNKLKIVNDEYDKALLDKKNLLEELNAHRQGHSILASEINNLKKEKDSLIDQIKKLKLTSSELESRVNDLRNNIEQIQLDYKRQMDQHQLKTSKMRSEHEQEMIDIKTKFQQELKFYEESKRLDLEKQVKNDLRKLNLYKHTFIDNTEKSLIQLIIPFLETAHQKSVFTGITKILSENLDLALETSELTFETSSLTQTEKQTQWGSFLPLVKTLFVGLLMGLLALPTYHKVTMWLSKTESLNSNKLTHSELENRKLHSFSSEQTDLWYENLTQLVLYNRHFANWYLDSTYQQSLNKLVIDYMFKQWRTDEEVSIKALSMLYSLIDNLEQKKGNIPSDFIRQNIDKMHETELETRNQIEVLLGSKVRYESFIKVQKNFYDSQLSKLKSAVQN